MHENIVNFRDLKRDVAKKLEKLERRTQRAIVELIRKYDPYTLHAVWPVLDVVFQSRRMQFKQ